MCHKFSLIGDPNFGDPWENQMCLRVWQQIHMPNCKLPKEMKDNLQQLLNILFTHKVLETTKHQLIGQSMAVLVFYFKPWFMEPKSPESDDLPPASKRAKTVKAEGYPVDPKYHRFVKMVVEPLSTNCVLSVSVTPADSTTA